MATLHLKQSVLAYIEKADDRLLKLIKALAESYQEDIQNDWWDELTTEEQKEIETGLSQADQGDYTANETVMKRFEKWH